MKQSQNKTILNVFYLILLFSVIKGNSQTDSLRNAEGNSYLTINLLSSMNTVNPRWRIGYIKNLNDTWKVGLDVGYGNRILSYSGFGEKISNNYHLWEIRPELYIFLNSKRKTRKYFSVELFYLNHKDVFYNGRYYPIKGESIAYDKSNYHRRKYGFNLKYGVIRYSKKRLGFNLYTGLGLRIRKNTFSKVINPNIGNLGIEDGDVFGFNDYKNVEGTNFGVNFSFGIKLYYRLYN
jgi:hypothetical protein